MQKTVVTIPTYNESLNISKLIYDILSLGITNLEIVVIDDNSPDGTWKIIENLSKEHQNIHLLLRKENKGRGLSGIEGFEFALSRNADIVIEMDADFSHNPKHIPEFLEAIKNSDVVTGSRFLKRGADRRGWKRKISTIACNKFANIVLGLRMSDPNSGYRCYKKKVLETIVPKLSARGADIVQDVIYNCAKNGFKINEIPIDFEDRKFGETTKTSKDFVNGLKTCLKLRFLP